MLVKCKTKSTGQEIQVYDLDYLKDLDLNDLGLSDIVEITSLEEFLPIYPLNDIILSQLTKKSTDSQKIENLGLINYSSIKREVSLIKDKKSRLSRSQRELVTQRYNDVLSILSDPRNGSDPSETSNSNESRTTGRDMV